MKKDIEPIKIINKVRINLEEYIINFKPVNFFTKLFLKFIKIELYINYSTPQHINCRCVKIR